ncbi:hypothetical protein J6590_054627 [Homalodisca vitripennis]|nr:hypothetical protein J6590_054627 [Homalodisca vitripennis]
MIDCCQHYCHLTRVPWKSAKDLLDDWNIFKMMIYQASFRLWEHDSLPGYIMAAARLQLLSGDHKWWCGLEHLVIRNLWSFPFDGFVEAWKIIKSLLKKDHTLSK